MGIHFRVVVLNAFLIRTARYTRLVFTANAVTLVLELALPTPFVKFSHIFQCAVVQREWKEMHLCSASFNQVFIL